MSRASKPARRSNDWWWRLVAHQALGEQVAAEWWDRMKRNRRALGVEGRLRWREVAGEAMGTAEAWGWWERVKRDGEKPAQRPDQDPVLEELRQIEAAHRREAGRLRWLSGLIPCPEGCRGRYRERPGSGLAVDVIDGVLRCAHCRGAWTAEALMKAHRDVGARLEAVAAWMAGRPDLYAMTQAGL